MNDSTFFFADELCAGVTLLRGRGHVYAYLIEGRERAVLLDTCTGLGNIREFVAELTSRPLLVVNTHGHGDHVGGNFDFEEICISPKDVDLMYAQAAVENRKAYLLSMLPIEATDSELATLRPPRPVGVRTVSESDTFDLGGRLLEIVATPGHTHGSICLLDRENRQLFAGDSCNTNTLLFFDHSTTVETYLATMRRLKSLEGDIDEFFVCHGRTPLDKRVIDDNLELCEEIMDGRDDALVFKDSRGRVNTLAKARDENGRRIDGRLGNIVYRKDRILGP